ncbi:MAG: protein-tyrosine phosphatase family protein [Gammaproteobacteria bacterium]
MLRRLLTDKALQRELKLENIDDELLSPFYTIPNRGFKSRAKLGVTKLFTDANVAAGFWDDFNFVSEQLIVSNIPYRKNCDEIIRRLKRKLFIVSVVDYFELGGNIMLPEIATPLDWQERGVPQFSFPIQDFGAKIPKIVLLYTLIKIREAVLRGEIVITHCKAGHGRSAMVDETYLAIYEPDCRPASINLDTLHEDAKIALDKADHKSKKGRYHIGLDAEQTQVALDSIELWFRIEAAMASPSAAGAKDHQGESKSEDENMTLDAFLASTQAKLEIAQLTYFKELAIYAASLVGSRNRTAIIRDFFARIRHAKDAGWYHDYHKILQPLLDAAPKFVKEDDKKKREKLIAGFFNELTSYLMSKKIKMNYKEETSTLKVSV